MYLRSLYQLLYIYKYLNLKYDKYALERILISKHSCWNTNSTRIIAKLIKINNLNINVKICGEKKKKKKISGLIKEYVFNCIS